ncbi:MAG: hypothetical protein ACUVQ9_03390 [Thermodesulfobacteriota bacterium]
MKEDRFRLPSPETILKETELLLEGLEVTCQFLSDHISNLLPLEGKLPEEKKYLIQKVEEAIKAIKENESLRKEMKARRYLTHL